MPRAIKPSPKVGHFPHATNATTQIEIELLSDKYGNDGYAVYFRLLELIHAKGGSYLVGSIDGMHSDWVIKRCRVNTETFYRIVRICCDFGLFDSESWLERRVLRLPTVKGA